MKGPEYQNAALEVVYAKAPFGGADQVFAYLGRYTHRVGISNARIQRADERGVTFTTKYGRSCTLAPLEFLRRLLLHVLPRGFHKIRHYGLCASLHVARGTLLALRDKLGADARLEPDQTEATGPRTTTTEVAPAAPSSVLDVMLALTGVDVLRCTRCSYGRLVPTAMPVPAPDHLDSS